MHQFEVTSISAVTIYQKFYTNQHGSKILECDDLWRLWLNWRRSLKQNNTPPKTIAATLTTTPASTTATTNP